MSDQTPIPFVLMRGGTSRGPFMRREDLPRDEVALSAVLVSIVGAGHPLNIDGLGGGSPVTTKTAMLSRSTEPDIDIDYFFAQVAVERAEVDYRPTCGNILTAVGPAAVELGLLALRDGPAQVRIRLVNTGARATACFAVRDGAPVYGGTQRIDGVPGAAAPISLRFEETIGSRTGALLPTGNALDRIGDVEVTCIDVAMPMVIARASDLGLSGYESRDELDADAAFFARIEAIRREAGVRMGLGDVSGSVVPKFGILAPPAAGGSVAARYFMPWQTHPTMAVTGSQCIAACLMVPGSVASGIAVLPDGAGRGEDPFGVRIEHPSGHIDVELVCRITNSGLDLRSAGLLRTARLIARGEVLVPRAAFQVD